MRHTQHRHYAKIIVYNIKRKWLVEFTPEEKKKLNTFLDDYEYLLQEGDYVTFLKKYREQNLTGALSLYYAFVDLIKETFNLNIESFIKEDPDFCWRNYFENDSPISHINIPAGVTTISFDAFHDCSSLTSITIPNSVTSIGFYAFCNCSNLATVSIDENSRLTSIDGWAFYNCSSLTSINIPDSATTIGREAFSRCSNLKTITIGENSRLTAIRDDAFAGCSALTSIYIPISVTTIGYRAFQSCSNLTIYCEASSRPSGWSPYWNPSDCPVVWGYKKK